ncbi:hypothetical protein [Nitrospina watsonii]|uniref:hypothetical protein n=1 Tax=Nitrospina watsonii TaxID=1323948 RepID=UPI00249227D5|nr:hypothetical protein [Nitrospina watsonii]
MPIVPRWIFNFADNLFGSLIFFIIGYIFLRKKFTTGIRLTSFIIGAHSGLLGFALTHLHQWTDQGTISDKDALGALMNIISWALIGFAVGVHFRSKAKAQEPS